MTRSVLLLSFLSLSLFLLSLSFLPHNMNAEQDTSQRFTKFCSGVQIEFGADGDATFQFKYSAEFCNDSAAGFAAILDTKPLMSGSLPPAECACPGLHEFLDARYTYYDICIWWASSEFREVAAHLVHPSYCPDAKQAGYGYKQNSSSSA
ncbi:hypothetical protein FB446DRAFT_806238 [Lentinula raphanica]|nr:hypothetical protein FB446DRAFT_806238 [Lentinula raphanica]